MGGHRASGAGDDPVDGPVDLAAVRADDALLDAIAGAGPAAARPGPHGSGFGAGYGFSDGAYPSGTVDDDRIAAVLAAWKADIEADPMPELVTLDEAVEAVTAGHEARSRVAGRSRRRMPFAIAAAAAVVAFTGLTVAVHGSSPGDTLWGVNKVLFSEHAQQVQKVQDVRQHILDANEAIDRRDYAAARQYLQQADVALPALPVPEQAPLSAERDRVESSLAPSPSTPGTGGSSTGTSSSKSPGRSAPAGPGTAGSPAGSATTTPAPDTTGTTSTAPEDTKGRSAPPAPTTTTPTNGMSSGTSSSSSTSSSTTS